MRTLNLGILAHGDARKTTLDDDAEWGNRPRMDDARPGCQMSHLDVTDPRRAEKQVGQRFAEVRGVPA